MKRCFKKILVLLFISSLVLFYCFDVISYFLSRVPFVQTNDQPLNIDSAYRQRYQQSAKENHSNQSSSPAEYYCNFPQNFYAEVIHEGQGLPGWKLLQVQIVIRHGDRTSINAVPNPKHSKIQFNMCNLNEDPLVRDNALLQRFRHFIENTRSNYYKYFLAPIRSPCPKSYLTVMGVLQHLQNGFALRKVYFDKMKFTSTKDLSSSSKMLSTSYPRTIQSAVAFMYGLLSDFNLNEISFNYRSPVTFCTKNTCHCDRVNYYKQLISKRAKLFRTENDGNKDAIHRIATTLQVPDRPGALMDGLVTGTYCKGAPLPCDDKDNCVTLKDLDVIMKERETTIKVETLEAPLRNQSLLMMQPMLNSILNAMQSAKNRYKNAKKFILYSGHDVSIRPLLCALDISDYRWPRLGCRFVFELWEHEKQHYIRVIYNGKDVTSKTSFCSGNSVCPLEAFSQFVLESIFKQFGAKTLQEACSVS